MRYALGIGLGFFLWVGQAAAQEQALTLAQAVELALASHPSLKAGAFELQAAEAQLAGARALASPEVRVTPPVIGSEGSDEVLSVEQPLEVNGARRARSRVAAGLLAETTAQTGQARADLVRRVKQAYWQAALTQQLVGLDRANVEFAQTLLEAARTQFELGNQPQVQALKAEVELARARQELLRSEAAAELAKAELNVLLGREPRAALSLADDPTPVAGEFALAPLQEAGLTQRPDVRQAEAAVGTARGEVSVARAARRSDVAVVGRLTPDGLGGVGLSVNFPQLDWGGRKADQQRTEALVKAREQDLEVTRAVARLEIANAVTAVRSAQAQE